MSLSLTSQKKIKAQWFPSLLKANGRGAHVGNFVMIGKLYIYPLIWESEKMENEHLQEKKKIEKWKERKMEG